MLVLGLYWFLIHPRYAIWALLVFMILAGAGAALVFEGVVSRVRSRWPGVATARSRRVLECASLVLVFGAFSSWFTGYDFMRGTDLGVTAPRSFSSAITSSVADVMRPGDHSTINRSPRDELRGYIRLHHTDLPWRGLLWPPDSLGWRAYGISASTHRREAGRSSATSRRLMQIGDDLLPGRLFVFDLVTTDGRSRGFSRAPTIYQYLEAHGANYQVAASFGTGMRGGGVVVYALNDWTYRESDP